MKNILEKISKSYNPKAIEQKIYQIWEKSGFFNPDKLKIKPRAKTFTIFIPPPNVTGSLHMGHALNGTLQDILIRRKRMQGWRTLWLPGTDHAGIATQNVVEKILKKEGLTRHQLGREKFLEKVWQWKEKSGNIILGQFKQLGFSCDWSRVRFTMDQKYSQAVLTAFDYLYKKGWIYQGNRLVNWCPRCATSLSDLELEHKEEKSSLWFIKYLIKKTDTASPSDYIIVATSRPETIFGDTAVVVNPKDKRYQNLINKIAILPIQQQEIPIIADESIDMDFGTGAVKVTPAHDFSDFALGQKHQLPALSIIDERGRLKGEIPAAYQGLTVLEARQKIVEELKNQNLLEKIEEYAHQIPACSRCGATIEPLISRQWFVKMNHLAQLAISARQKKQIIFYPKNSATNAESNWDKIYLNWLKNIQDWCVSRQIWWGHRLPVWQCQTQKENTHFVSLKPPQKCPLCQQCQPQQIEDVLDTWFSSALWPLATLGWPDTAALKNDFKKFYPAQTLTTARDIINLWVSRMIFFGLEFTKKTPFKNIYIHPTVLTKEGKRMSKSLGTGIDPLGLINKYGADATRFGLVFQILGGQDLHFTEDHLMMGQKFCNKIWNASRFVLSQLKQNQTYQLPPIKKLKKTKKLTAADRKILNQLEKTIKIINRDLENFKFGQPAQAAYHFFWHQFCDQYIEAAKKQNTPQTEKILLSILLASLKLLHPFMPFVTEELYQKLPIKKKKMLMIEDWPDI